MLLLEVCTQSYIDNIYIFVDAINLLLQGVDSIVPILFPSIWAMAIVRKIFYY